MQKSCIGERTESERVIDRVRTPRGRSDGPAIARHLTEALLADRWHRSTNTLVGWRTRRLVGRREIPATMIGRVWYYADEVIESVESDPTCVWVRPAEYRSQPLPPLRRVSVPESVTMSQQAELPLSLMPGDVEWMLPAPAGFAQLRIESGYALAIGADGRAFFAPVLGGLEFLTWTPVASLPTEDELVSRFARRVAA
jgi:hypothetical protein